MSEKRYTKAVEKELIRVSRLATRKETENRIQEISSAVTLWEKKKADAESTLEAIRQVATAVPPPWSADADPGVPVAFAVSAGYISKEDLSDAAWKAIEVLVTVADI